MLPYLPRHWVEREGMWKSYPQILSPHPPAAAASNLSRCVHRTALAILTLMSRFVATLDRRLALGVLVLLASAGMLAVGLFSVIAALTSGGADLPHQGSIQAILADSAGANAGASDNGAGVATVTPPVRFGIPRLNIDAPVITMGLDANHVPQVPDRPDQIAWYSFSAAPGKSSNAVFSGHVDWQTSDRVPIPGVFYRLRELEIGDLLNVTLADGTQLQYRVTGNVATPYNDPNVIKAMQPTTNDVVTLITCGGTWTRNPSEPFGGNYSHRVIVRAERVVNVAGSGAGG